MLSFSEISALDSLNVIGKSEFGRNIYALIKGKGGILVQGGMHAREHVTVKVLLELLQRPSALSEFENITIIPCMNPDGMELCLRGAKGAPMEKELLKINGSEDFSMWKANGRGVDLNVNFDALWGRGKHNKRYPSPSDYIGEYPESESETRALTEFTRKNGFSCTISLHAKGEEVYSGFNGYEPDEKLARKFAEAVGYPLKKTEGSVGGYKDWCVDKLGIPAFTVELGREDKSYNELYSYVPELEERLINGARTVKEYLWTKNI